MHSQWKKSLPRSTTRRTVLTSTRSLNSREKKRRKRKMETHSVNAQSRVRPWYDVIHQAEASVEDIFVALSLHHLAKPFSPLHTYVRFVEKIPFLPADKSSSPSVCNSLYPTTFDLVPRGRAHRERKGFTLFLPFPVGHAASHPFAIFAITGQRYT